MTVIYISISSAAPLQIIEHPTKKILLQLISVIVVFSKQNSLISLILFIILRVLWSFQDS